MEEHRTPVIKCGILVFLYAILLLCTFFTFDCTGISRFAFGYYSGHFILYILTFGLVFLCFIIVLVALILEFDLSWRKNKNKEGIVRNLRIRGGILLLVIIYLSVNIFLSGLLSSNSDNEAFNKGFYVRVKQNINIHGVREWLNGLDEETFKKWSHNFHPEITDPINIPKEIFVFKPSISYITLFEDEQGNRCVDLEWGGPLGRWGVVVGSEEIEMPPSDYERYGRYRFKFEEGVYSWQQIR